RPPVHRRGRRLRRLRPAASEPTPSRCRMKPFYADEAVTLYHGDALAVLAELDTASVDAVCTDPPYGLEFMGREWDSFGKMTGQTDQGRTTRPALADGSRPNTAWRHDGPSTHSEGYRSNDPTAYQSWCRLWATECLRVLKPGGHLLAFGGTRTWHRLARAISAADQPQRQRPALPVGGVMT